MKIQASEDMVASFTSGIPCMLKGGQVCEDKNAETERKGVIGEITPTKSDLTAFGTLDPKAVVLTMCKGQRSNRGDSNKFGVYYS